MANIYDISGFPVVVIFGLPQRTSQGRKAGQGRKEGSGECFNILRDLSANNAARRWLFHSCTDMAAGKHLWLTDVNGLRENVTQNVSYTWRQVELPHSMFRFNCLWAYITFARCFHLDYSRLRAGGVMPRFPRFGQSSLNIQLLLRRTDEQKRDAKF